MRVPTRVRGMTLIELMVALAIMAIVAAVAIPIYTNYTERGFRSQAQADLMGCAQGMERHASLNFTYEGAAAGGANAGAIDPTICRRDGADNYNINVNATANTFDLVAIPTGQNPIDDAKRFFMDETGMRGYDTNGNDVLDAGEDSWPDY